MRSYAWLVSAVSKIALAPPTDDAGAAGAADVFFERAEVRDVLAWVRLLSDPNDAAAVVRALGRPPIELRQVDIARVVQVARRSKLDLVAGLGPAIESPGLPPEARDRIEHFRAFHHEAELAFERLLPHLQVTPQELVAELTAAAEVELREGGALSRQHAQTLEETVELMREEVLGGADRIASRLGELRLDTDLDISHGVVRYLELVKLAALKERPAGQSVSEALADINLRLMAACTPLQREIFETSPLDEALLAVEEGEPETAGDSPQPLAAASPQLTFARREEPSLQGFLPKRSEGLVLSASDIDTYRSCPLRYKLARVLKVPSRQTFGQRFGIAVHQALERYHAAEHSTVAEMMELFESCWRKGGFGESENERELHGRTRAALVRYHERLEAHEAEPVWFERSFAFKLGKHHLRGRVDRVDRLPDGAYEMIDYKTSRPKTAEQLKGDVQLSLYAVGARESWELCAERLSYYYVLDDLKLAVPSAEMDPEWIARVVEEVGEAIMAQRFEPTPSPTACGFCDYQIACPAWER
jgi:DNA helicase II / ATP-dependent DNA helicase PcrA